MSQAELTHYWLQGAERPLFILAKYHWPSYVCDRHSVASLAERWGIPTRTYRARLRDVREYVHRCSRARPAPPATHPE